MLLANGCFELLSPIIEKYEGTIDTSIGEGIVTLFGAPISHEDDAERALRAALEVRIALSQFNFDSKTNIGLRCGINTGLVVVAGERRRGQRRASMTGATINFAVRLRETSKCGDILVGASTHRLTESLFEFETLSLIPQKPGEDTHHIYRLLMSKSVPHRFRNDRNLESELVGRTSEIRSLGDAIQRLRNGAGSIVTLVGEAGLGKSRLVTELREQILSSQQTANREDAQEQAAITDPVWAEGRCLSFGGSVAYHLCWTPYRVC